MEARQPCASFKHTESVTCGPMSMVMVSGHCIMEILYIMHKPYILVHELASSLYALTLPGFCIQGIGKLTADAGFHSACNIPSQGVYFTLLK
jgi:hypothetical protein